MGLSDGDLVLDQGKDSDGRADGGDGTLLDHDGRADGSDGALLDDDDGEISIIEGLDFHVSLVRLDDDDALSLGELVALGLHLRHDFSLGHHRAQCWHEDLVDLGLNLQGPPWGCFVAANGGGGAATEGDGGGEANGGGGECGGD